MQPDEDTGSAEEQPAGNMATPRLETVEYRGRSVRGGFNFTWMAIPLRKPLGVPGSAAFVRYREIDDEMKQEMVDAID